MKNICTSYLLRIAICIVFIMVVLIAGCSRNGARGSITNSSQCRIPLPDGSGFVEYKVVRLKSSFCAEFDRKIRFETNKFRGQVRFIPGDSGGGSPVNVYWYPAKDGKGPYLRFQDCYNEYLADLVTGKTLLIVRNGKRNAFAGEIKTQWPESSISGPTTVYGDGLSPTVIGEAEAKVDGHPARKLEAWVALKPGEYIGSISDGYGRFIPKKEAPEKPIPMN